MLRTMKRAAVAAAMATALTLSAAGPAAAWPVPVPPDCGGVCFYTDLFFDGAPLRYNRPVNGRCYNLPLYYDNRIESLANGTRIYNLSVFTLRNCARNSGRVYLYRAGTAENFAPTSISSWMAWN